MNRDRHEEQFSAAYSLNRNTVNIFGEINTQLAEIVIAQLQYLDDKFRKDGVPLADRKITIQINSPGGNVSDGLAIYDTMNFVEAKIETVGLGLAASMGAFLLAAGTKGLRRATENCEILIHQPLGGARGQASDIIIAARNIERTRTLMNTYMSEMTGQPIEKIMADTDRDNSMTAAQAKEYGLIDVVIPKRIKTA